LWVKVHVGIYGNEIGDKVAKEAAQSTTTRYEYKRIPKTYVNHLATGQTKQKGRENGQHATRRLQQNNIFHPCKRD